MRSDVRSSRYIWDRLMIMKMKKLVCLFACLLPMLWSGCDDDDDASDLVLMVENPENLVIARSGDVREVRVRAFSDAGTVTRLTIGSYDTERGERALLDTTLSQSECRFSYYYTVPSFVADSIVHELRFAAWDDLGHDQHYKVKMTVRGGSQILSEYAGMMLYAGNSGREDALSLDAPTQPFIRALADSAQALRADIYAYADSTDVSSILSREWRSASDVLFVRHNSFDYASATSTSIRTTYNGAVRAVRLTDIQSGDIVLVGRGAAAWGVIRVVMVYDGEGTASDGYLLNFKAIGQD